MTEATSFDTPPSPTVDIARHVALHGGRALIVGGWVRDQLLGRASKDVDLEVYGIDASALASMLTDVGRVNTVGESFTVFKVGNVDVSLPRRESKTGRGHRGFTVHGDPQLSFVEAARRRDFTINAIGFDPLTQELFDPYQGAAHLRARRLQHVDSATFADDSLRVLRALQFAARFELTLAPETATICRSIRLDDLPAERVWGELEKLLLQAERPSIGLALGQELGILGEWLPELVPLIGCPQEPEWHPEGDVWTHTLMVVDQARQRTSGLSAPEQVALMLGAVAHDLGKPATTALIDGRIRSLNHEEMGVPVAHALLDRVRVFTMNAYDVRRQVVGLVANHLKPGQWHKVPHVGDGAFRRLAAKVDLELLARLSEADCRGRTGAFDCSASQWFRERAQALGVEHQAPTPILLGRHLLPLGVQPGSAMGAILKAVFERQLDGEVTTLEQAVAAARDILARQQS